MSKKPLHVSDGTETLAEFELKEVRRESLYGSRTRLNLDESGNPCSWGQITPDGVLIREGMLGQATVNPWGLPLKRGDIKTFAPDGSFAAVVPSSHDVPPVITECSVRDVLDCAVEKVYELTVRSIDDGLLLALESGSVFRTTYSLSATTDPSDAFLVANRDGVFLLVGQVAEPVWVKPDDVPVLDDDDRLEDDDFMDLI